MEVSSIGNSMAAMATDMKMVNLQTEASAKVLNMAEETMQREGDSLIRLMNASFTGLGQKFDMSV
ncbi:MAG: putative motility protein [Oscillospiraceae bacterium]|nr:putative motility protein [Oscillospiraceae bacterium]